MFIRYKAQKLSNQQGGESLPLTRRNKMITTTVELTKYELGTITTACYEEWHRLDSALSERVKVGEGIRL